MEDSALSRRTFVKMTAASAAVMSVPIAVSCAPKEGRKEIPIPVVVDPRAEAVKNASDSDRITREYFDSLLLETSYIDSVIPSTECRLFGHKFDTPIMTAALSHLGNTAPGGMVTYAKAAAMCNAVHWVGMGDEKELEDILATGAKSIKIVKPYENNDDIFRKIEHAVRSGCIAVGMDTDHSFNSNGGFDYVLGYQMHAKTADEIARFVKAASGVPFIIKGVLSVKDAEKCLKAGVSAIVISHHHGMIQYAVPPLMVIGDILKAVGGKMKVFVDCGIISGMDAYKCMALGADAVSVGRHLMPLLKDGPEAVADRMRQMTSELAGVMARTGIPSLDKMDPGVIHRRYF
ncbi:MAG: alpha-hydroxy-acid oxidizing protein [Bacteroidales bacterium]|nr:alpha-hydroxy-acid oxidizing protein [Bacteroidales bacterium]